MQAWHCWYKRVSLLRALIWTSEPGTVDRSECHSRVSQVKTLYLFVFTLPICQRLESCYLLHTNTNFPPTTTNWSKKDFGCMVFKLVLFLSTRKKKKFYFCDSLDGAIVYPSPFHIYENNSGYFFILQEMVCGWVRWTGIWCQPWNVLRKTTNTNFILAVRLQAQEVPSVILKEIIHSACWLLEWE